MATQQITINGANGVYNVYEERDRWTIYQYIGTFSGEIDDSTTLKRLIADNEVKLIGFAVKPQIVDNPRIGGFENESHKPPVIDPVPPQSGVFDLHILPCIDEVASLRIWSEKLTVKDSNLVEVQLLTHSLMYNEQDVKNGKSAMCNYTLRDIGGTIWARMEQRQRSYATQLGGSCGNNHPRFEDDQQGQIGLGKYDCKIYVPKNTYFVDIENTGDCDIMPWIHQPHTNDGENRDIYKQYLASGNRVTVEIPKDKFNGEFHRNALKINANNL